jgi:hypothetical protein
LFSESFFKGLSKNLIFFLKKFLQIERFVKLEGKNNTRILKYLEIWLYLALFGFI